MAELITALLTYGPLGIISGILLKMYLAEKQARTDDNKKLNKTIQDLLEKHNTDLENLRSIFSEREKEYNQTLKEYGKSVVDSIEQVSQLAERVWSIRK